MTSASPAHPPKPASAASKPSKPEGEYILGTNQTEHLRLGLQHRLWSASAHNLWERARVTPGSSVLDVGCGPGHAALDLAEIVGPTGRILGIDESAVFLKHLNDEAKARGLKNVDRVLGDVQQLASLLAGERAKFDLAYARWVLCFVKDPESVIAGIAASLKPGGRLAVQDYFNYESMALAPRREEFARVIRAVAASWRSRGGDPDIVARLPGLCRKHGLQVEHLGVNQRVATPDSTMWHWPDSFWKSFVPRLVEGGFITSADQDAFFACWREASGDVDSFMVLPPVFDLLAVKR